MNKQQMMVLERIDREDTLDLIKDLIRIPSHRDVPEQESNVARYIAKRMEKSGLDVRLRDVYDGRLNVVAIIKGSGGGHSLTFNGHTDTVPIYGWKGLPEPFSGELVNGKIYGRGSVDMKGGLAAMIVAMEAIKSSGTELRGDLIFTGVVGEEGSCSIGTQEIIRNGPRTDFAIVGEPTRLDVEIANRGSWDFIIIVRGKTAHSGEPEKGINAISKTSKLIQALEEEIIPRLSQPRHPLLGHSVMNISKIDGGIYGDVVPDICKLSVRIRYSTLYKRKDLKVMVKDVLQGIKESDPEFDAELTSPIKSHPWRWGEVTLEGLPREISADNPIVRSLVQNMKQVAGSTPKLIGSKGWGDASLLVNDAGIPAVTFGPGNGGAHSPLEYLEIGQLHQAAKIYTLTSLDICNKLKYT